MNSIMAPRSYEEYSYYGISIKWKVYKLLVNIYKTKTVTFKVNINVLSIEVTICLRDRSFRKSFAAKKVSVKSTTKLLSIKINTRIWICYELYSTHVLLWGSQTTKSKHFSGYLAGGFLLSLGLRGVHIGRQLKEMAYALYISQAKRTHLLSGHYGQCVPFKRFFIFQSTAERCKSLAVRRICLRFVCTTCTCGLCT